MDGDIDTLLTYNETKLYTEVRVFPITHSNGRSVQDRIGLRTLDEAGKVSFWQMPGEHMQVGHLSYCLNSR